jgi:hypothetical protein
MKSRHHTNTPVICLALLLLLPSYIFAGIDLKGEFGTAGGYTDNLFNDSADIEDSFSSARGVARFYPLSLMEIELKGDYTYYGTTFELSNFLGSAKATCIPTGRESRLTLYISSTFDTRAYREGYKGFNNNIFSATISAGYRVRPTAQLRMGVSLAATSYTNLESSNFEDYEIFAGGNFTFLGSSSLDVEAGYAIKSLDFWKRDIWRAYYNMDGILSYYVDPDDPDKYPSAGGHLGTIYISPRYSRSIGEKLGFTITYAYRSFQNGHGFAVSGLSTGFLSPWASVYQGEAVTLNIKTYLLPGFILSSGAGYWKRDFLKSNEDRGIEFEAPYIIKGRHDEQNRLYLSIQKPFIFHSGIFMEPNLQVSYTSNNSSNRLYDYSGSSIAAGIIFKLL